MGEELFVLGAGLVAAAVFARVGRRIGLPTIPLFMLAGVVLGPHTPGLELVEHPDDLALLAKVGLILLLFHLGLELSFGELVAGGRRLLSVGAIYLALNMGTGILFGLALGWGTAEALVLAGAIGISSSAIASKLLTELRRLANPESRLILGIIVVEDVFLALYLAVLQPILGDADGVGEYLLQSGRAFAFLLGLAAVARWGSRLVGRLVDTRDDELLTVCFVGLAVGVAGLAEHLGVSDAIGAFMVGLVLAESRSRERIERLVLPLRDTFAAMFFFWFGLTIDPSDAASVALPVAVAVLLSLVVNVVAGLIAARIHGYGPEAAANVGLTILGRGEFSLVLASLAAAAGLDPRVTPFVALYVLVLAIVGPLLATRSASIVRRLPANRAQVPVRT
ncbi:MAG: cation:proton antiporter [Acidimicrobiia bacterium]|nr:cation:proton antiporter [Acidimicrobiia bacterium]